MVNRFGYRNVLVAATLLLALVSLSFLLAAMLGWLWLLPVVLRSLIHISEPTRRYAHKYAAFGKKIHLVHKHQGP
ncbi:hypothetical protein [Serratia marcescens]|uniref:hypothetical protein n=1 Tax=Serratia marcescens TaxID=615 RepID=UPI000B9720FB|nr:hypothetical protein CHR63_28270 [Serratia marcescens]